MNRDIKKINAKIYQLGQMIGLNKKDMNSILNDIPQKIERSSLLFGPKPYWANFYGTLSIKDFQ